MQPVGPREEIPIWTSCWGLLPAPSRYFLYQISISSQDWSSPSSSDSAGQGTKSAIARFQAEAMGNICSKVCSLCYGALNMTCAPSLELECTASADRDCVKAAMRKQAANAALEKLPTFGAVSHHWKSGVGLLHHPRRCCCRQTRCRSRCH